MRSPTVDSALAVTGAGLGALVRWRIAHGRSDVLTGMLFLAAAGMALAVLLRLSVRMARRPHLLASMSLLAVTTTLALMATDLVLRYAVQTRLTYGESNGSRVYRSIYRYDNPSWYNTYGRNRTFREVKVEFTHERRTNALGLTERDMPEAPPDDPGEFRVLALGDSFTEGVGAAYDEAWVRVVERRLTPLADGRRVRAYNAGVSGSDLLQELALYRDKLADLHPRLVVVALNNSDITDVMTRGGMARFRPDGRTRSDRGPWWDWLYGINFLTRHVVHDVLGRSWLLLSPPEHAAAQAEARIELRRAFEQLRALAESRGAALLLALTPHQFEITAGAYDDGFRPLAAELLAAHPLNVIDLLAEYKAGGVLTAQNSGDYYWPLDFHPKARGYALMGDTIATALRARHLVPSGPAE